MGYTYATRQTTPIIAHFECHSNFYRVRKKFQKHRQHQQDMFLNTNFDSTPRFNICTVPCHKCKDPHVIIQCSESRAPQVRIWRDSRENSGRSHVFKLCQILSGSHSTCGPPLTWSRSSQAWKKSPIWHQRHRLEHRVSTTRVIRIYC